MKRTTAVQAVLLTLFVSICVFLLVITINLNNTDQHVPEAIDGVIDFQGWSFSENGEVDLKGDWEFYWGQLLEPTAFQEEIQHRMIKVPLVWDHLDQKKGYATYRLLVNELPLNDIYGLKIMDLYSAYTIWIDGEKVLSTGTIGDSFETEKAQLYPQVITFTPTSEVTEIVLQISNFHFREGGIWYPPTLGISKQIHKDHTTQVAFDYSVFVSLLLIGLIHIILYINRRKDKESLWFGLFCLAISLRSIAVGEMILMDWFPEAPLEVITKFSYFWYFLTGPFVLLFLYNMYKKETSLFITKVISIIGYLFASTVLFLPASIYTNFQLVYNIIIIVIVSYVFYVLIKAMMKKRRGAFFMFLCFLFFSYTIINDILVVHYLYYGKQLTAFGLLVFVFSQSYVSFSKLARTFREVEEVREELKKVNETLDEKIIARTEQLERSQQKLLDMNEQLSKLSYSDGLTQVANRRLFDQTLMDQWKLHEETQQPISLLLLDVDFFKGYNDKYGHLAGDDCLRNVALTLNQLFSEEHQLVARYGGEEFAIILSGVAKEEAILLAEFCKENILNQKILHSESPISPFVTASIGVATMIPHVRQGEQELVQKADEALYLAKAHGRDKVMACS
ncbi:diguanylate cyclase [Halalkalibacter akibai]|uniref:Diguanylate cyclase n=1 Tax=Halalkalibacter akibai (strain ATCC 43226 / DSM 21942 / CIP 109018 / JCM 9157 / 1139) TaxID=1236973 RepID=W4QU45_HALA3|nr:diguanylate cyclase [Halalkalibacter akibai]GAE34854.1 diguanylate cyclase [Halalkalibacter akibai JCM 9157]